jgi:GAF domain-containing protein
MTEQLKDAPALGLTTIDKLRMLLDITNKISRSLDLQEVLNLVMDTLDSLIPYDAAGIFVVQCVDKELVAQAKSLVLSRRRPSGATTSTNSRTFT